MLAVCSFSTSAYSVTVQVLSTQIVPFRLYGKNKLTFADISVELVFHPAVGSWSFSTGPVRYVLLDWNLVANYFEKHTLQLLSQGEVNSAPHGLALLQGSFIAQAKEGYVLAPNESGGTQGVFHLEFMINVGELNPQEHPSYLGGTSSISTDEALRFVRQLRSIIGDIDESE